MRNFIISEWIKIVFRALIFIIRFCITKAILQIMPNKLNASKRRANIYVITWYSSLTNVVKLQCNSWDLFDYEPCNILITIKRNTFSYIYQRRGLLMITIYRYKAWLTMHRFVLKLNVSLGHHAPCIIHRVGSSSTKLNV